MSNDWAARVAGQGHSQGQGRQGQGQGQGPNPAAQMPPGSGASDWLPQGLPAGLRGYDTPPRSPAFPRPQNGGGGSEPMNINMEGLMGHPSGAGGVTWGGMNSSVGGGGVPTMVAGAGPLPGISDAMASPQSMSSERDDEMISVLRDLRLDSPEER
jgi:hypothetical protein